MPTQQPPLAVPYTKMPPTAESLREMREGGGRKASWVDDLTPFQKKLGLVAMVGSSFFFAIMALVVKVLANRYGKFELVFWRSLFMTVFSTFMCYYKGLHPLGPGKDAAYVLSARGIAGFFFMACFYAAIASLPLSDAVVITYISPVLTTISGFALLGEPCGMVDSFGTLLSLTGVILVSKPTFLMGFFGVKAAPMPVEGTLWALGAALSSTSVYLLLRFAKHLEPMVATNYFAMWGTILGPVFMFMGGETFHFPPMLDMACMISLAVLSVTGQNLMNIGIALESAGKAVAMNYTQVAWAFLFQLFILHDWTGVDVQSVVGAFMIASWGVIAVVKDIQTNNEAKGRERTVVMPTENHILVD